MLLAARDDDAHEVGGDGPLHRWPHTMPLALCAQCSRSALAGRSLGLPVWGEPVHTRLLAARPVPLVFEAYEVPLNDKEGEEPKRLDFFEETFLTMSQLKRENGVWWLDIGVNRRRDEDEDAPAKNEEVNQENNNQAENVELNEEATQEGNLEWEVVNEEAQLKEEQTERETYGGDSGLGDKFFDVVEEVDKGYVDEVTQAPAVPVALVHPSVQPKGETKVSGVDPSGPSGHLPDFELIQLQAEFAQALQANIRF
ncbi:hypothetical protein Dimus_020188 [Dionaea muscipula]